MLILLLTTRPRNSFLPISNWHFLIRNYLFAIFLFESFSSITRMALPSEIVSSFYSLVTIVSYSSIPIPDIFLSLLAETLCPFLPFKYRCSLGDPMPLFLCICTFFQNSILTPVSSINFHIPMTPKSIFFFYSGLPSELHTYKFTAYETSPLG